MRRKLIASVCVAVAGLLHVSCTESSSAQTGEIAKLMQVNGQLVTEVATLRVRICRQSCDSQYFDCAQQAIANTLVGQFIASQRGRPAFKIVFSNCNPDGCPEEPRGKPTTQPKATCSSGREACLATCK
jgi:hypothetical protein